MSSWLVTLDYLLLTIQEKIKSADMMSEANKKHPKEFEDMSGRSEEITPGDGDHEQPPLPHAGKREGLQAGCSILKDGRRVWSTLGSMQWMIL
ncbi:uncharacterized protein [Elaeis guineensis]|uniref:Uncharacterized protein LOC114914680 isoform X2 n=1 Tax=Elaeis guineensis var. tenera TaxID=51953 RepID=A0A8N4IGK3_ELAGV|nr:uncharacterized protein LOC114914680 isoform X2 [Elaeis guineensis]